MDTIVIPANFIEDLEKKAIDEKCNVVGIEEMSVTYTQPADTCSSSDKIQHFTITTQMNMAVGNGEEGFYFNITIPKGEHWSVDEGSSLMALIDDFKKRLYMVSDTRTAKTIVNYDRKRDD